MNKRFVVIIMSTLLTVGIASPEIFASGKEFEGEAQYTSETEDSLIGSETDIAYEQDTNAPQNEADVLENETSDDVINAETNSSTDQEYTYSIQRKSAKASSSQRNSKIRKSTSRKKTTKRVKKKSKRKTVTSKAKSKRTTSRRTRSSTTTTSSNSSSTASNSTIVNVEQYENEVISLVNQERKKAGVAELTIDSDLMEATDIRAKELVSKYSHTRPDGTSCFTVFKEVGIDSYRAVGENIARGQKTPAAVMESWMNSSGHRRNILSANYERIGVGCYQGADGKLNWVQLFYTPSDDDD